MRNTSSGRHAYRGRSEADPPDGSRYRLLQAVAYVEVDIPLRLGARTRCVPPVAA